MPWQAWLIFAIIPASVIFAVVVIGVLQLRLNRMTPEQRSAYRERAIAWQDSPDRLKPWLRLGMVTVTSGVVFALLTLVLGFAGRL